MAGVVACALLLLAAARPVWAAPTASQINYPSGTCAGSLQECIDGATNGDTIVITAGTYITSFNLYRAISLTGVASNTVIFQALPNQRVMTATGAVSTASVISGMTFTGGDVSGAGGPDANCGGGVQITGGTAPLLVNVIISGNVAATGAGLCVQSFSALRLVNSLVASNTATGTLGGGGARALDTAAISGSLFRGNQCTGSGCFGGGLLAFGSLTLTSTTFLSNTSHANGGGLYAFGGAPVVMTGGLFQRNQCTNTLGCDGGAVYAGDTLAITSTQFISNEAHARGGAVGVAFTATVSNALFQNNACLIGSGTFCIGGAVYAIRRIDVTNTNFLSNSALLRAGALYADGSASLTGGEWRNNRCTDDACLGGAVTASGPLQTQATSFVSNTAREGAGAIYAVSTTTMISDVLRDNACTISGCQAGAVRAEEIVVTNGQFLSNTAQADGGGLVAGAAVTLVDSLFQGNRCLEDSCDGGAVLAATDLTAEDTQFIANQARRRGGAVYVNGAGTVAGGLFRANTCTANDCFGGGLAIYGALVVTDTQFLTNSARLLGGGVYAEAATSVSDALFQGNTCTQTGCGGGGLFVFSDKPLTMTNTLVLTNTSVNHGGGVQALGTAMVSGGRIEGNRCTGVGCRGGGLYVSDPLTMTGTVVRNNQALEHGGGAYTDDDANLASAAFENNVCTEDDCHGGAVYVNGSATLEGTALMSNTARASGGGAYVFGGASLSSGRLEGNQCTAAVCAGGGLYVILDLSVNRTQVIRNNANDDGGGIYAGGNVTVTGALFEANACTEDNCQGGGLYGLNSVSVANTDFMSNTARFSGGGAYANVGGTATVDGGLFQGNACTQTSCRGGGLDAQGDAVLTGTQFIDNQADFDGGGLRTGGALNIDTGVFRGNQATQGAGLYHAGQGGQIVNTEFANNVVSLSGGAMYLNGSGGTLNVLHVTIASGIGHMDPSAVQIAGGSVGITNTIIASYGSGIVNAGGATVYQDYNLFYLVTFTTAGNVGGGAHSFSGDPLFRQTSTANWHLLPGSQAVNAGVDAGIAVDFEGTPRPHGSGFDIGYDEAPFLTVYLPLVVR